jgi:hypothetical protein
MILSDRRMSATIRQHLAFDGGRILSLPRRAVPVVPWFAPVDGDRLLRVTFSAIVHFSRRRSALSANRTQRQEASSSPRCHL